MTALHRPSTPIYFASSSRNKYEDYKFLLGQYAPLQWAKMTLDEIQTLSSDILIRQKIKLAEEKLPYLAFLVEQTGLFIDGWNELPGNVTGMLMDTVGNKGLCKMLQGFDDRAATAVTDLGYHADSGHVHVYRGVVKGTIAPEPRGTGGFGWDAIFIPAGESKTFAQMSLEKKNSLSTRMLAVSEFYKSVLDDTTQAGAVAKNRVQFRQLLLKHFTVSELKALCFDLNFDQENVLPSGAVKREQAIALILHCDHRSMVSELLALCRQQRPRVTWPEIV